MSEILRTENVVKEYRIGSVTTKAIDGISLSFARGEFVALTGKSGSGKSTLLYQMSLLDRPTSGEIYFKGEVATKWNSKKRIQTRLSEFGYVFQDYALVPELSALENVSLPHFMMTGCFNTCTQKGVELLEKVGLGDRLDNRPSQLSGGEQQRVSIARALVNSPAILFADEPTANLDTETSKSVFDVFRKFHEEGLTIIMVTHEPEYALLADRVIELADGRLLES